jgi:hypothetical protein
MKNNKFQPFISHRTRFENLGYRCEAPGQWSFIDYTTLGSIGPKYTDRLELLADIDRFAK